MGPPASPGTATSVKPECATVAQHGLAGRTWMTRQDGFHHGSSSSNSLKNGTSTSTATGFVGA